MLKRRIMLYARKERLLLLHPPDPQLQGGQQQHHRDREFSVKEPSSQQAQGILCPPPKGSFFQKKTKLPNEGQVEIEVSGRLQL